MDNADFESRLRKRLIGYIKKQRHESDEQIISEFISKGDNASFLHDIEIDEFGEFISDISEEFDIKYPYEVKSCAAQKMKVVFLWFFTINLNYDGLYYGEGDIRIKDLKEAIELGHWHCKYANRDNITKNHVALSFNLLLLFFLLCLFVGLGKHFAISYLTLK